MYYLKAAASFNSWVVLACLTCFFLTILFVVDRMMKCYNANDKVFKQKHDTEDFDII